MTQTAKLTASDGASLGSVSISGSTVAATGSGAAYVFTQPTGGWANMTQTAKLTSSDGASLGSISISGATVAAGASTANTNQGAAYVFTEPGGGWANMNQPFKVLASDGASGDAFGGSLSVNGNTLVVGAASAASAGTSNVGTAYVFAASSMPVVTGVSPTSGPVVGGASVTIMGGGFTAATKVDFGGIQATSFVVNSDAQVTATSPAGTAGTVDVTVTTSYGTSATSPADRFTYMAMAAVTGVSSTTSTGMYGAGTVVPISVTFNEPVTVTGAPQLALNAGSGVTANYSGGSGTPTLTFTYTVAAGQSSSNLDYTSTAALGLNGGTIEDAAGSAAVLALPSPGANADGLAAASIVIVPLSDSFESGDFSGLAWQLSSAGVTQKNWTVQKSAGPTGGYAAQSGAIGAQSSCTMSLTLTEPAGELAFWRKVSSASASGLLIFEIDGVPIDQWSGTVSWQQSFFWVSAGQHTFSWLYGKDAGTPAGSDAAWLDDIQFLPGTTLAVEGTSSSSDQFRFDGSSATVIVSLNGEFRSFTAGEFSKYVFLGDGSEASLTGSSSGGNSALLYGNGSAQLTNATAGYAVTASHMGWIQVYGQSADTAQFFDSPGNDVFDANPGFARMHGPGYFNMASGFGTNIAYSTNGGSDTAEFLGASGSDTFYAYADYDNSGQQLAGAYAAGSGYSNTAKGFATNIGSSSGGGTAGFFDSPGNDSFYAYADYNTTGQTLAGMYGNYGSYAGGYSNSASGFATNLAYSTNGGSDTAAFFDSPGNDTFYAYADYNKSGQTLAGMYGSYGSYASGYSNSAKGFSTNLAYSTNGGSDTAVFFDSPGNDTFYAYADYNNGGQTLAGMYGSYGNYASGYSNSAKGFGTNIGLSGNGGSDTASLYDSPGNDTLYTDAAIASLYGDNGAYVEQAIGFAVVNAFGTAGGVNTKGVGSVNYQLNYFGKWGPSEPIVP
jgi:hypothetical protein